jgi:hypothetical protein
MLIRTRVIIVVEEKIGVNIRPFSQLSYLIFTTMQR